ncbi:MAG: hypothetical protein LBU91_01125 [Bacteroidales bacterium]|jgi:hypothetical protein|nr:hypothetical protein [Bacteroidales bacterium]
MKQSVLILLFLFAVPFVGFAQLDKPLRAEVTVSSDYYPFSLINLEKKGVLLHTAIGDANKSTSGNVQDFLFYDVYLNQKWQLKTQFPTEYAVINHALDGEVLHLILRNQIYRSTLTPTLLMRVNLLEGSFAVDTLYSLSKIPTAAGFTHQSRVWLVQVDRGECAVNTAKIGDTLVFKYDFPKFSSQEVVDAALDTVSQKLAVLYADDTRRDEFFTLAIFDTLANLIHSSEVKLNDESRPVQAKLRFDKKGQLFIYGTFNLTSERQRTEGPDRLQVSTGFFNMAFNGTSAQLLRVQNFADFDSVDQRFSADQLQVLQHKRNRRQKAFSLDILSPFHVKMWDDKSLLFGESIMPQYKTTTETYYDYYGRVVPYTTSVFDGYRFNDAFVWILDTNGILQKNYVSDISTALNTRNLATKTAYFIGESETIILFANATNVFYKTLLPYETSYQTLKLQPLHRGDKVVEDTDSRILQWYDTHFLVYGYQTIQNNNLRGSTKRIIFYLSKVSLD